MCLYTLPLPIVTGKCKHAHLLCGTIYNVIAIVIIIVYTISKERATPWLLGIDFCCISITIFET